MVLSSSTSLPYPSPYLLIRSFRLGCPPPPLLLFRSPHVPRWMDGAPPPPPPFDVPRMLGAGDCGRLEPADEPVSEKKPAADAEVLGGGGGRAEMDLEQSLRCSREENVLI